MLESTPQVSAPIVADPMAIVSDTSVKAAAPAPNFAAPAQPKATKKSEDGAAAFDLTAAKNVTAFDMSAVESELWSAQRG